MTSGGTPDEPGDDVGDALGLGLHEAAVLGVLREVARVAHEHVRRLVDHRFCCVLGAEVVPDHDALPLGVAVAVTAAAKVLALDRPPRSLEVGAERVHDPVVLGARELVDDRSIRVPPRSRRFERCRTRRGWGTWRCASTPRHRSRFPRSPSWCCSRRSARPSRPCGPGGRGPATCGTPRRAQRRGAD